MHPAKSVIFFTVASGAGYGLFIWIAVLSYARLIPPVPGFGLTALFLSLGLIVSGLLSSTFHLGHPERAWRALSQWRSSWLSREGVIAILTFIPLGIFSIGWIFFQNNSGIVAVIGLAGALMSLITVFTTSMIYASLKTIPAWHNIWTKLVYIILCLMSGGVLMLALTEVFGMMEVGGIIHLPVIFLLIFGFVIKIIYWRHIHTSKPISTAESATGLGRFGKVSLAASPHGEDNFLLKEMGFEIARKHAKKIRIIASFLAFIVPGALIAIGIYFAGGTSGAAAIILAAAICFIGLAFERWLFFAEAKHVVTLYYGESKI
ncbi:Anaerobic dimethyl sulfoxide reductase chain C, anchor subunit [hydrothermal vent metagenome]|uniref:Anaerobic dimethyl sulfoxide reductase chain C, anchor subunit n=1 Tax=hydrothermal vent metagenome TaxID=652676 RepID=A0A3B0RSD0_9ZZZZ